MANKLVIYHGKCSDGFCSAYLFWKVFGDEAQYFGATYGEIPPDVEGKEVYIVDFSYPRAVMEEIRDRAQSLVWLDHHVSAVKDMDGFDRKDKAIVRTDMEKSGAGLAYLYLEDRLPADEKQRLAVLSSYIEDQDLWRFAIGGTKEFSLAERSYPQDFRVWDTFDAEKLVEEGKVIRRFFDQKVKEIASLAYDKEIFGHKVLVANCPFMFGSDVGHTLDEGRPFGMTWYFDGVKKNFIFSLRSREDGVDVSELAKKAGGGGHKHAAGFSCSLEKVDEIMDLV